MRIDRIDWTDVDEPTPWAKASIHLMQRIAKVGWEQSILEELDHPTIEDSDWLKMVIALVKGEDPPKPAEEYDFGRYRCPICQDRLYVPGHDVRKSGRIYSSVQPCASRRCPAWQAVRAECEENRTAKDRSKGKVKHLDDIPF